MEPKKGAVPEHVRAQLLKLGVPEAKQAPEDLRAYFPPEFHISAAGLDGENLARVLVHLCGQGLITLPASSAGAFIKKVAPGWHFCQFYREPRQVLEMVAPYFAEGLANEEGCLWVLPDDVEPADALKAISRHVPDLGAFLAAGQLEILNRRDWYLDAAGRFKSFEEIAAALVGRQDQAMARGFSSLRAAGDAGWTSGTQESRDFIDYERKVNAAIGRTKIAAVCTFRADVTADELIAIIDAHRDALSHSGLDG
jgi:hypothetical protein